MPASSHRNRPNRRGRVIAVTSIAGALLVALLFVGVGRLREGAGHETLRGNGSGAAPPRFGTGAADGESAGDQPGHDSAKPPSFAERGAPPPVAPERVTHVMGEWRNAIVLKNAETVEAIDDVFRAHPDEFLPALMDAAKNEPEPRVRAFCTRVLGKLRRPESVARLRELLGDPSEFVRHNAAWALAQTGDVSSLHRIEHLAAVDPSSLVRTSATESVAQLRATLDGRRGP